MVEDNDFDENGTNQMNQQTRSSNQLKLYSRLKLVKSHTMIENNENNNAYRSKSKKDVPNIVSIPYPKVTSQILETVNE